MKSQLGLSAVSQIDVNLDYDEHNGRRLVSSGKIIEIYASRLENWAAQCMLGYVVVAAAAVVLITSAIVQFQYQSEAPASTPIIYGLV